MLTRNNYYKTVSILTFDSFMIESKVSPAYAEVGMVPTLATTEEDVVGRNELSVVTSLVDRTDALIRGLDLVLTHHGVDSTVRVALSKQVHDYLDSSKDESVWLKRGKFLLSDPFAQYLDNERPEFPDCGPFVPKGVLRSFYRSRLLNYCRKNTHLWFSWMQAKRSCLPASEDQIQINYDKHFKTLSSEDPGDDDTISRIMSNVDFKLHLDEVRGKIIENFIRDDRYFTDFTPSISASYENSRADGGSYGTLISIVRKRPFSHLESSQMTLDLEKMTYIPKLIRGNRTVYDQTISTYCPSYADQEDWKHELFQSRRQIKRSILLAKIQGIVEPMKVRVISKGNALLYYAMKPLQVSMHTSLRNMPSYRLIGRPLSPTDVMDLWVSPKTHGLRGDEEWISVDYSGATDNLSWKYSGSIFKYIIQDLPKDFQDEALEVLGPHYLSYPKAFGKFSEKGIMKRGQLMGSILSFPILCLANLGLYLDVTQDYQKNWTHEERMSSVLVNGDDQLYLAPKELFYKHIEIGSKVGLEMTVGKAYHHYRYTNVNSTCVDCPIGGTPYQIDFLNSGLYYGQNKVMGKVGLGSYSLDTETRDRMRKGIVAVLPEVLRGSLPGRSAELLRMWMRYHNKEINKDTIVYTPKGKHYRNLFLPIPMGGMGVLPPLGFKLNCSRQDRMYAASRLKALIPYMHTSHPLPKCVNQEIPLISNRPVQTLTKDHDDTFSANRFKSEGFSNKLRNIFSVSRMWLPCVLALPSGVAQLA